eukprot:g14049.t1
MQAKQGEFSTGPWDCFSELRSCCCTYFCGLCALCDVRDRTEVPVDNMKICCGIFCQGCVCAVCCCPEKMMPCVAQEVFIGAMKKWGIPEEKWPGPCGNDTKCCGARCDLLLPCTAACMMCLLSRETLIREGPGKGCGCILGPPLGAGAAEAPAPAAAEMA